MPPPLKCASSVPLRENSKVAPSCGPPCTTHVPASSPGMGLQIQYSRATTVPVAVSSISNSSTAMTSQRRRRPQQASDQGTADSQVKEVGRHHQVVGQQRSKRANGDTGCLSVRPAGQAQGDKAEAGHPTQGNAGAGKILAQQPAGDHPW